MSGPPATSGSVVLAASLYGRWFESNQKTFFCSILTFLSSFLTFWRASDRYVRCARNVRRAT